MVSWEPVDIDPTDRDEIEEEDDKWDDNLMSELERKFEELRRFSQSVSFGVIQFLIISLSI